MNTIQKLLTLVGLAVFCLHAHSSDLYVAEDNFSLYRHSDPAVPGALTLTIFPRFAVAPHMPVGCYNRQISLAQSSLSSLDCQHSHANDSLQDPSRYYNLAMETRNIGIMSLVAMMIIFALPEDVSNWERDQMKPKMLGDKWLRNNRDGPVWDKDDWTLNYIGHPYFGAVYYVVARNQGFGPAGSFTYSFLMSTFLWEMGIEAFAEVPSKQDILVTPIVGSILGEAFYIWEQRLLANGGTLWGSSRLGSTALFLVNPAGHLSQVVNRMLDGNSVLQEPQTNWVVRPNDWTPERSKNWAGLEMSFRF